jgi:amidase
LNTIEDVIRGGARALAAAIRSHEVSPVEVVEVVLDALAERNESLNAFVYVAADEARERAREAERAVLAGERLGLLHGVPTAIKDLFDFHPGWPATFGGVRRLRDTVIDARCVYAERMEEAGAILVGKTNSPVMGFRGTCDNPLFGPTRNPFDLTRNSGGSSGGSAAAVADGILPLAEGTDGGGSVRIPAAWCGVVGFKASFGRVPSVTRPNGFLGLNPFLAEGVIARSVEDVTLGMRVLSGYDPRDPFSLDEELDVSSVAIRSLEGVRIGYTRDYGVFPVDAEVARVVEGALASFEDLGARVEPAALRMPFDQRELSDLWCRLIVAGGLPDPIKALGAAGREDLPAEYLAWLDRREEQTLDDLDRDQRMRTAVHDEISSAFAAYDFVISPTVACLPVKNASDGNTVGPREINGVEIDPLIGWCPTYLCNFTGHPAISVPAGLSSDGLPVGLQIIGRRYADADVLAAAARFEEARPWAQIYEICAGRALR